MGSKTAMNKMLKLLAAMINNAFIAAGILDDPRAMLKDMNYVMEIAMGYEPKVEMDASEETGPNEKPKGMDYEQEVVDKMNEELDAAGLNANDSQKIKNMDACGDVDDVEVIDTKNSDKKASN